MWGDLIFKKFTDEWSDEIFFGGVGLGDKESEGGQGTVADFGFAVFRQVLIVHSEEDDKEEGTDTFVAVIKGVIFDDKIQKMGGFFGDGLV